MTRYIQYRPQQSGGLETHTGTRSNVEGAFEKWKKMVLISSVTQQNPSTATELRFPLRYVCRAVKLSEHGFLAPEGGSFEFQPRIDSL